jgi:hypothetical protein
MIQSLKLIVIILSILLVGNVHYLHIPALERIKIPDEDFHTLMFRVMTIT